METILSADLVVSTDTFKPSGGEEKMSIAEYISFMRDTVYPSENIESTQPDSVRKSADGLSEILVNLKSAVTKEEIIKSAKNYRQAIRINPDEPELHFKLGISSLLLKDRRSALEEYKILKELDFRMANELIQKWNVKTPWSSR